MKKNYNDIINLPYPRPSLRPRMSMTDRAAQFSPFAALTGHGAAIQETARLTDFRIELDDYEKAQIDKRISQALEHRGEEIRICYFLPDERKAGGQYVSITGCLRKVEPLEKCLILGDGVRVPVEDILSIEGEIFPAE